MTDAATSTRRVTTWIVAGGLLLLVAALGIVSAVLAASYEEPDIRAALWIDLAAAVVLAVACGLYAFGLRRGESAVGRRPFGVVALVLLAVCQVGYTLWWMSPGGYGAGVGAAVTQAMIQLVIAVLTLLAVIAVATARAVPGRWRWMPLIAWGAWIVLWLLLGTVLVMVLPASGGIPWLGVLLALVFPGSVGVASIVLGLRGMPAAAPEAPASASAG
ncbi:hypothetical protein ACFQRL_01850 [Microbacterium fluvii]|uniref:Uncharacterized protein n=1 Tax=Microbacterium fluvii TaxID=415215 RepID=A0ABW2HB92_9MICO|nr:hypothetical protein [Microbacterium fluvii]MCU4671332.1 hypothetical protein [Microbacterium fluvii]